MMLYGNLDVRQDVVFDDRGRRTVRVTGTDLETNSTIEQDVIVEKFVERRLIREGDEVIGSRKNTKGETVYLKVATEDEVLTKVNAGTSKTRRNIILALLPPDLKEEALATARETVKNRDAKDPDAARKQILDAFYTLGVTAAHVQELVGGKPLEQLNPAELGVLRTIYRAIEDGEATWEEVMADEGLAKWRDMNGESKKPAPEKKGTAGLKEQVKQKAEKERTDPKATEQPELDEPSEAEIRKQDAEIVEEEAAASQAKGRKK